MPVHGNSGSEVGRHRLKNSGGAAARSSLQPPTAFEADDRDDDRAADHHEHLQHVRDEHGAHAADDRVDARREHDDDGARPEVDAHQRLEDDAAGRDRHGDLRQHVADDRDRREIEAHARRVTRFEELGHREHAGAQIERHEQPAEQEQCECGDAARTARRETAPDAPLPASPTRCSEPMLVAKIEAPTMNQPALRPAKKNSVGLRRFVRL